MRSLRQRQGLHSTGGDRAWKHDHYFKNALSCGGCGSRLYYVVAKGRFGYFRCVGRNTRRTKCSRKAYIPAHEVEQAVEDLYAKIRLPRGLERQIEQKLKTEIADREKHRAESTVFLGRRLKQLANEREKVIKAYYADALDVATLKREQARINAEVAELEKELVGSTDRLKQAKEVIEIAIKAVKTCAVSYAAAEPDTRRVWNEVFFQKIVVKDGRVARVKYQKPFSYFFGSHKGSIVVLSGRLSNHAFRNEVHAIYQVK